MSKKRIAVIPGDGIGKEVMPEGVRVKPPPPGSGSTCISTTTISPAGTTTRSTAG